MALVLYSRKFVLLLACAIVGLGGIVIYYTRQRDAQPWRPLPGGGEVRLVKVTHGRDHVIEVGPRISWSERISAARAAHSLRPLFNPSAALKRQIPWQQPSLCLWFLVRGRPNTLVDLGDAELILANGQRRRFAVSGGNFNPDGTSTHHVLIPICPTNERELRLLLEVDGAPWEFAFRNPAFGTQRTWRAESLPQTKQIGSLSLTLRSLTIVKGYTPGGETAWVPRPSWSIEYGGREAIDWFRLGITYEDEGGNSDDYSAILSEPVWRVRCRTAPTNRFPFPDGEIQWIGTLDPARGAMLAPQHYELFPLPDSPTLLKFAGLFGSGKYHITKEGVSQLGPAISDAPSVQEVSSRNGAGITVTSLMLELPNPAFVALNECGDGEVQVTRDLEGAPIDLARQIGFEGPTKRLNVYAIPGQPVRFGLVTSPRLTFDFYVQPPAPPK